MFSSRDVPREVFVLRRWFHFLDDSTLLFPPLEEVFFGLGGAGFPFCAQLYVFVCVDCS